MNRIICITMIAAVSLGGCFLKKTEKPVKALQSIILLYEERDFESLVRTRYAEIAKAENEEKILTLIHRFETLFEDQEKLDEAISIYQSALKNVPEITDDGMTATFKVERGTVKLSKMSNGKWGFHL